MKMRGKRLHEIIFLRSWEVCLFHSSIVITLQGREREEEERRTNYIPPSIKNMRS
jgi:hypothetical protein